MSSDFSEPAACGLIDVDATGNIVDANAAILGWVDRDLGEVQGQPLSLILDLRLPVAGTGGVIPSDAMLRRRTGSIQPVVVGSLEPIATAALRLAVFDVSSGSAFENAFHIGTARTRRGQERLQILFGASTGFAEMRTKDDVAQLLADVAQRSFSASAVSVFLHGADGLELAGGVDPLSPFWPDDFRPGHHTLKGGEVTIVRSPAEAAERIPGAGIDRAFEAAGMMAALASPLVYRSEPMGAMVCFFDHPRQFDDEAAPLAEALTNQAAQAIGRLRLEESLRRAAMHDDITGLPNRRLFEEQAERVLDRSDSDVCVVFIDMDGFKAVNDELGHSVGDDVLREAAIRIRDVVRGDDTVGRYGGDEFIAIAHVHGEAGAEALGQRIREALGRPFASVPAHLPVSASIGAAVAAEGTTVGTDRLLRAADQAMYRAKAQGGDRVHVVQLEPQSSGSTIAPPGESTRVS